ncbi:MAG: EAL domain-containing protein [Oscillospiraceae bacterium]|nr:EAL domain-containing protein [Oscillospiraceae bacterium]
MNISVQCCSIVLLLWIVYMYNRSRQLPLKSNKAFQNSLYMTLAGMLLDVASNLGIAYSDLLPAGVPEFLCKTHVVSLLLVAMMAVVYVFTSVMYHLPSYKRTMCGIGIISAIEIGLIYLLPIGVHYDQVNNLPWIDGPSTIVAYAGVCIFIIFNLIQIHHYRKHIYNRQRSSVVVWMFMWLAAAMLQYFNETIMVVGFATALSIVLVFIQFENPELYLDRTTGLFNVFAYKRYVEQLYREGKEFSVVGISFAETPWQDNLQPDNSVEESQQLYNAFLKIPGAYVFKIQDNEIMLVFPKVESAKYAWGIVTSQRHMPNIDALPSRPSIYYVPDPRCVNSPREILELLRYVSMRKSSFKDDLFHIIDSAMMEQILAERATAQMIRDALDEDRVVVYYQPIYSVEQKCFTSAEALVRIIDQDGKLVPPGAFIQIAEDNGLIIELGKRVLEKTCRFYQSKGLDSYGIEYIEVNLSVAQCTDARLSEDYIGIIENSCIEPCRINLEITESTSAQNKQTLISHMEKMISCGVNFSLDDFGSGASNLNYIVDMPVEIVKFDREMIQAYFSSGKAKYVMNAAMHMIHGMGLKIVAEGIETEEQYRKMEEIKINYIQGFYFSKPLPEQEFLAFLCRTNVGMSV